MKMKIEFFMKIKIKIEINIINKDKMKNIKSDLNSIYYHPNSLHLTDRRALVFYLLLSSKFLSLKINNLIFSIKMLMLTSC